MSRTITLVEAVREALAEEMRRDERVFVLGEDVGLKGGVFKATDGLQKEFGEERVVDSPLGESGIVGVAVGAALNGMRPIAEIQFADFIHPAMNQIISEAARIRYRSNGAFGCPLVIRAPFGGGVHGALYHSQCVEALFFHVPGLKIVAPSNPHDMKGLLKAAIRDEDPVLVFEHKRLYRRIRGEVPEDEYTVPIGPATIAREGENVTVVTYGAMVHTALEAAEALALEDVSVEVVDLRTLLPLDKETISRSVAKTSKVVVLHEDNKTGGIGAEIAAILAEELFEHLDGPIVRVAAPDVPAIPYSPPLEEAFLPSAEVVSEAIRKLVAY